MADLSSNFDLIQILEHIPQTKIICVGDVMLDCFTYGAIDRISPEAPIPVMQYKNLQHMLGGSGNVARNLVSLGAQTILLSVSGTDEAAKKIQSLATDLPHLTLELLSDSTRPTTQKTRFIAGNQQIMRLDEESKAPLHDVLAEQALQKFKQHLPGTQAVIFSDYGKGMLTPKLTGDMIALAKKQGVPVLVDPKGFDYGRYKGATVLCPNIKELAQGSGCVIDNESDMIKASQLLMDELELQAILVTRGKDGMSLIQRNQDPMHLPAMAREVYDVSGAGDTVIATMASAVAAKSPWVDAAYLANIAAGIVVAKMGTAIVTPSEIDEAILQQQGRGTGKYFEMESLLARIQIWRQKGYRIGFTNGCFDLIHPGHISLLRQARANCDRLIVGLNSDESIKRLKGESRPIQNQDSRSLVMASLDSVDGVILFDDDTPIELIRAIRPDVLVKGADYTVDKVVGADFVQSYGGKIFLAQLEQGHSTTNTVKKIAGV